MAAEHISSAAGIFSPAGYAEALKNFGDSIKPAVFRGARTGAKIVRSIAVSRFTREGVGKGIFGKRERGAFKLIKSTALLRGDVTVIALELRGFAAMQDQGGHTKPHDILPVHREVLRLKTGSVSNAFLRRGSTKGVAGALGVFRPRVHHPGSAIPRHPFGTQSMMSAAEPIRAAMEREIVLFTQNGVRIASSSLVA